jgi:hypothetical protein
VSIHDGDSDRKVGYLQRKYANKISSIMSAVLATNTGFYVRIKNLIVQYFKNHKNTVHKILKDNPVSFNTA